MLCKSYWKQCCKILFGLPWWTWLIRFYFLHTWAKGFGHQSMTMTQTKWTQEHIMRLSQSRRVSSMEVRKCEYCGIFVFVKVSDCSLNFNCSTLSIFWHVLANAWVHQRNCKYPVKFDQYHHISSLTSNVLYFQCPYECFIQSRKPLNKGAAKHCYQSIICCYHGKDWHTFYRICSRVRKVYEKSPTNFFGFVDV